MPVVLAVICILRSGVCVGQDVRLRRARYQRPHAKPWGAGLFCFGVDDEDGAGARCGEDFSATEPREDVAEAGTAVAAHDDDVGVHFASERTDGFGGAAFGHAVLDVDAVDVLALADRFQLGADVGGDFGGLSTKAVAAPRMPGLTKYGTS